MGLATGVDTGCLVGVATGASVGAAIGTAVGLVVAQKQAPVAEEEPAGHGAQVLEETAPVPGEYVFRGQATQDPPDKKVPQPQAA